LLILTSHESLHDPNLLEKLKHKGIGKFVAFEVPVSLARERYGGHFRAVESDLHETDDLRVLDFNGQRVKAALRLPRRGVFARFTRALPREEELQAAGAVGRDQPRETPLHSMRE
jgi:hypothetical protein